MRTKSVVSEMAIEVGSVVMDADEKPGTTWFVRLPCKPDAIVICDLLPKKVTCPLPPAAVSATKPSTYGPGVSAHEFTDIDQ